MKNIITSLFSIVALLFTAGTALAHTGHIVAESVHGFLHVEHIIMLAAAAIIVYLVKVSGK